MSKFPRKQIWHERYEATEEQLMELDLLSMLREIPDLGSVADHWGRNGLMVICAVRYCIGRQTYIVEDCVEWVLRTWDGFPEHTKKIIQADVEAAFKKDADDRAKEHVPYYLSNERDKRTWYKLRALWGYVPPP